MALYKLFSCNLEIQYRSGFLSKAMLFTICTTLLNITLPFIIAYRGKGFWLRTERFFEQPAVHFTYDYLLVMETDDPSRPIICGDAASLNSNREENCSELEVQQNECNDERKNCMLHWKFTINIPPDRTITSVILMLGLDFQLQTVCPLHMQSMSVINRQLSVPTSGLQYYGDLQFYQIKHLPCVKNTIDTKYNSSLFTYIKDSNENVVDFMLRRYFDRDVTTQVKTTYSRTQNGHTGNMDLQVHIRIPEMEIYYVPSLLQELKWAWPQYLSLLLIFYWLFDRIKRFVFNNRLLMAWEVLPWKK